MGGFVEVQDQRKETILIGLAKFALEFKGFELLERFNSKKGSVSKAVTVTAELRDTFGLSDSAKIWAGINLSPRDKEGSMPAPSIAITDGEMFVMYTVQFGRFGGARVSQLIGRKEYE